MPTQARTCKVKQQQRWVWLARSTRCPNASLRRVAPFISYLVLGPYLLLVIWTAGYMVQRNFFYYNRIVDAWNILPNTVFCALSTNNFKMKLREVNLDSFLTIFCRMILFLSLCFYFFRYCIVFYMYFMCFSSISVAVWPFVDYLKRKWKFFPQSFYRATHMQRVSIARYMLWSVL